MGTDANTGKFKCVKNSPCFKGRRTNRGLWCPSYPPLHQHQPGAPQAPLLGHCQSPVSSPAGDQQVSPAHQDMGRDGCPGEVDVAPGTGTHPCLLQVAGCSQEPRSLPTQRSRLNLKFRFLIWIVMRQPSQHNHRNKTSLKFTFSLNWAVKLSPPLMATGCQTDNLFQSRSHQRQ